MSSDTNGARVVEFNNGTGEPRIDVIPAVTYTFEVGANAIWWLSC